MRLLSTFVASFTLCASLPALAATTLDFANDPASPVWQKGKALMAANSEADAPDDSQIQVATTDLNGDGRDEIIVRYFGPGWCGTLGCYTQIFSDACGSWKWIGHLHALDIGVGSRKGKGWKPLIVDDNKRVTFSGDRYEGL